MSNNTVDNAFNTPIEISSSSPQQQPSFESTLRNKSVCFFHLAFKIAACFLFLFGSSIFGFIMLFIIIVLFSAFDFWIVKNISGRILVGLRWFHEVQEDGSSKWIYLCKPENSLPAIIPSESYVFWMGIYAPPIFWIIMCIMNMMSAYLIVAGVPFVLTGANLIGYWKCQADSNQKIASFLIQRL